MLLYVQYIVFWRIYLSGQCSNWDSRQSNFAEHIFNTHHTFTDIETNLEILHTLPKGPKLTTTEQHKICKHYKQSPTNILNDQIHYKSHTLFDTIKHSSHNNISAILTTMNWNIAASTTGTVNHWKWCTWHRKASAKNQVSWTSSCLVKGIC